MRERNWDVSIISPSHDLLSESKDGASVASLRFCKIGFSQVRSGLPAEWKRLVYDMTGTRLGHLSHHGVSPLLPKPGQPITLSVRLQSSQESSGVHPNPPSVYTHACNTQTHMLEISTNGEGGDWQTKSQGKGHKPQHTVCAEIKCGILMSFVFRKQKKPSCSRTLTATFSLSNFT